MSIQVETEKLHSAKRALKEAAERITVAQVAASAADKSSSNADQAVIDAEKALQGAKDAVTKAKEQKERAMKETDNAAEAETQAVAKVAKCEKSFAKVKKNVEDTKAAEDKFGKLFDEMDVTKNGVISHNELKKYIAQKDHTLRLQLGIGRWQEFLDAVDTDGDRQVSRDEFVNYFTLKSLDPIECWGAIFDAIDTNGDGSLTQHELRNYSWNENPRILQLTGFTSWKGLLDAIDVDASGTVERDEWLSHFAMKEITGDYRPAKRQKN